MRGMLLALMLAGGVQLPVVSGEPVHEYITVCADEVGMYERLYRSGEQRVSSFGLVRLSGTPPRVIPDTFAGPIAYITYVDGTAEHVYTDLPQGGVQQWSWEEFTTKYPSQCQLLREVYPQYWTDT